MRGNFVGQAMAGEEGDRDVIVFEDVYRCGWVAPWCQRIDCCNGNVAVNLLETFSADDCNMDRPYRSGSARCIEETLG